MAQAFTNRCWAYHSKHEPDRAIPDCNKAIRLDPTSAVAYHYRGKAYSAKGQPDDAIAYFDQTIQLDPTSADAFTDRSIAYSAKDDQDRATPELVEGGARSRQSGTTAASVRTY